MPSGKTLSKEKQAIVVNVSRETWEKLRKLAFDLHISMAELVRTGIDRTLKEHEKKQNKAKF